MATIASAGTFRIKRTTNVQFNVIAATAAPYSGTIYTTLNSQPGYTNFTGLFDQYRMLAMRVTFYKPYTQTGTMPLVANASQTNLPQVWLHSVVDFDDASALSNIGNAQQYPSYNLMDLTGSTEEKSIALKPRIAVAAYAGAFTSYANMPATTWIDAASPGVQYYGVKYLFEPRYADGTPGTFGAGISFYQRIDSWWEFRNPRG